MYCHLSIQTTPDEDTMTRGNRPSETGSFKLPAYKQVALQHGALAKHP